MASCLITGPRRGETFVTKKIVSALCKIKEGKQKIIFRKFKCKEGGAMPKITVMLCGKFYALQ